MTDTPSSRTLRERSLDIAVPGAPRRPRRAPRDARYEAARLVDNAAIDRRPAAIVLARDVADIVATLRLAGAQRARRWPCGRAATARSGYGSVDDAIVLDSRGLER